MFSNIILNKKNFIIAGGFLALVILAGAALVFYKYNQRISGSLPDGNSAIEAEKKTQQQLDELNKIKQDKGLSTSTSPEELKQDLAELEKIRQERKLQTPTTQELKKQFEELNRLRGLAN